MAGRIVKVSGPLVVAERMNDARMFDVVRVSDQELIGEVIELRGDRAWIQVYEETGGLGPGDPVYSTGGPLSVELGPGLIESIYDGIQRPLDVVRTQVGDYIARGVNVPGLDREKKWAFQPVAKAGDEMAAGDVLGTVLETPIIEHKIMVPPGVQGKVKRIEEGELTVEDPIAVLDTPEGERELTMMQRWPVRESRPYKRKLAPEIPLVTGQRVIDTFFTVGKGGTACVPGPFGSGKCVIGETPVLLADGEIVTIEELYDRYARAEGVTAHNGTEAIVESDHLPEILTLQGNRFDTARPSLLYSSVASRTIRITTRGGRTSETTPEHEYRVLRSDWRIHRVRAEKLEVGDRILVPRSIEFHRPEAGLDVFELLGDDPTIYVADEDVLGTCAGALRHLNEEGKLKELSAELDVPLTGLYNYMAGRYAPQVSTVKRTLDHLGIAPPRLRVIRGKTSYKGVALPDELSAELAEFLGLVSSDGTIAATYVGVRNTDEAVLKRFAHLTNELFGLTCTVCEGGEDYQASSTALSRFVGRLLDVEPGTGKGDAFGVPRKIMTAGEEIVRAYLKGYFHGDGSISKRELYFPTISRKMALGLCYLLLRLGVVYRIETRKAVRGGENYRVVISGRDLCERFLNLIHPLEDARRTRGAWEMVRSMTFSKPGLDSVPVDVAVVRTLIHDLGIRDGELKQARIYLRDYLRSGRIPTEKFKRLVRMIVQRWAEADDSLKVKWKSVVGNAVALGKLLESVYFDEIKRLEGSDTPKPVFDFTVPGTHNFVASFGWIVQSNTVIQHQLAKWADAQIIVFIGCGERGNEMASVLLEFPELEDPHSGYPLMKRTVLIANTSNMPVAAREASVYTGITIAEYFRDMGYSVALMADSTSRWAEAMREISGRLEEMPGEEGYPAYLGTRVAAFYERAGRIICQSSDHREGALTVVGAVSPPGGDLSDAVVQATLRVVKVFWSLEDVLAYRRHFPAISWLNSYSLYQEGGSFDRYFDENVGPDFIELQRNAMRILQQEADLEEIVRLVGVDSLSPGERLILETARSIREDFLHQNAFHEVDTYSSLTKQYRKLRLIMKTHRASEQALENGATIEGLARLPVKEEIARAKFVSEEDLDEIDRIGERAEEQIANLMKEGAERYA